MKITPSKFLVLPTICMLIASPCVKAESPLWQGASPVPEPTALRQLDVEQLSFSVIKPYEFETDGYRFLHGLALAEHKGTLYASFGHNKGAENTLSEEARYATSRDGGRNWSEVKTMDAGTDTLALSHGSFLSHAEELWAFMGAYRTDDLAWHTKGVHTRAYKLDHETGDFVAKGVIIEEGFWPMETPRKMPDGNWIMAGLCIGTEKSKHNAAAGVAISDGDDFLNWDVVRIPTSPAVGRIWGECGLIHADGVIHCISRYGGKGLALVAESRDMGRSWTELSESNLPMVTSKPASGTLSSGHHYLINSIYDGVFKRRAPLSIAISDPGSLAFTRVFQIRPSLLPDGPGESHKNVGLSYPYALEHDGYLYVGYSNNGGHVGRTGEGRERWNNNSAELVKIPLSLLSE